MGQAVSDPPKGTRLQWRETVEQYRAEAKRLCAQADALSESARRDDALSAIAIRHQASQLAQRATQIESYFLYGEVYTIGK